MLWSLWLKFITFSGGKSFWFMDIVAHWWCVLSLLLHKGLHGTDLPEICLQITYFCFQECPGLSGAECTAKYNSFPYYSKSRGKTEKGPGGVAIQEQSLCHPSWIPGAVSQKSAWRLGVLTQDPYCSKSQPFCTQIFCSWGLVHFILKTVAFSKLLSFASVVREDAKGLSPPSGWEVHSLIRPWVSSTNRNQTPVSISSKEERTGPNHYSRCAMCRDWACEP